MILGADNTCLAKAATKGPSSSLLAPTHCISVVRLKLFKGDCRIVGRKSDFALYDHALATYDAGDSFDHTAAVGFIKIYGLPVELSARKSPDAVKKSLVVSR